MKLYVAGKVEDWQRVKEVAEELERRGHTITHKWWEVEISSVPLAEWPEAAIADLRGVRKADAIVAVLERNLQYRGTLAEIGAALVLGKKVYLLGDREHTPMIFLWHPNVVEGLPVDEKTEAVQRG